jgi:RecB family endonuclease NucS
MALDYSEKDIENLIIENDMLLRFGITVLTSQYPTRYGIIDILGYRPESKEIMVIELKKGKVDENAVGQLMRYMAAIKEMQFTFKDNAAILPYEIHSISDVKGILMGTDATPGVLAIARTFDFITYIDMEIYMQIDMYPCITPYPSKEDVLADVKAFLEYEEEIKNSYAFWTDEQSKEGDTP